MKIVVLGKGFLGTAFEKAGFEVRDKSQICYHLDFGFSGLEKLKQYDIIINCIGNADTRYCEKNFKDALKLNGELVGDLKTFCEDENIKLVHISTGCVYDDYKVPCKETDFTVSHCNYVMSKLYGESFCDKTTDLIIRPRLLYGDFLPKGRNNLLKKIKEFTHLADIPNSFTSVHTIVEAVKALLDNKKVGIYNVADIGEMSMSDIGHMFDIKHDIITMKEIRKNNNLYLVNSIMDISKLKETYTPPNLKDEIRRCNALI